MVNIEKDGDGDLHVFAIRKSVDRLIRLVLVVDYGEPQKTHFPSEGCLFQRSSHEFAFEGVNSPDNGHLRDYRNDVTRGSLFSLNIIRESGLELS